MEKHEQFKDDEGLWSLAMSAQMAEFREKNNLLDSYDEGLEEGTKIGTTIGMMNLLVMQIQQKYELDAKEWLSTLSLEQLYELSANILTCNSFEELQQTLNK